MQKNINDIGKIDRLEEFHRKYGKWIEKKWTYDKKLGWFTLYTKLLVKFYEEELITKHQLSYMLCGLIEFDDLSTKHKNIIQSCCNLELPYKYGTSITTKEDYENDWSKLLDAIKKL